MQGEHGQPMSPAEIEAWREQREKETARRAMWKAWQRLAMWLAGGVIAINAGLNLLREIFGPPGK